MSPTILRYGKYRFFFNSREEQRRHVHVSTADGIGFLILVEEKEYFVPFREYPAFKDASVNQILNSTYNPPAQLCWESLDIDIELQALSSPEDFPPVFR
jgi:hypothetical protein